MSSNLYILGPEFSNFVRSVMLCCEEKGLSYQCGMAPEGSEITFKSPEHFSYHPYGKVPVLIHDGRALFETTTICRYLDQAFDGPALQPEDPWARAQVDERCAEIALYIDHAIVREMLLEFVFPQGPDGSVRMDVVEQKLPAVRTALTRVEQTLGDNLFMCGDAYTLADALITPMLDYVDTVPMGSELIGEGKLRTYLEQMRQRPSAQKVLK